MASKKKNSAAASEARDDKGRFTQGNRFWEARSSCGRKPIFKSADALWLACLEYFAWVEENPLKESRAFAHQGHVTVAAIPKMRAMTIAGLCIFLDIGRSTWDDWKKSEKAVFSEVIARVEEIIRVQKFEGASADLLNANIIARDLGLAERNEHTGANGGAIETKTDESSGPQLALAMAALIAKGSQ
ncbi:DNA-packaging protein [uncultured Roseibium sp.]|uniref:DNA-packaging protein n=1 Tax=uncultured Roseibium sp. TaxID=1936171 RepID=UPI0025968C97|nr:DNA-packaging protein [uncultured Roseibium sp.]